MWRPDKGVINDKKDAEHGHWPEVKANLQKLFSSARIEFHRRIRKFLSQSVEISFSGLSDSGDLCAWHFFSWNNNLVTGFPFFEQIREFQQLFQLWLRSFPVSLLFLILKNNWQIMPIICTILFSSLHDVNCQEANSL